MPLAALQTADVLTALAILSVGTATGFAARAAWKRASLRRLVPGALVSVGGLLLLIAFYRWGFSQGDCGSRGELVCLTNENQGVLTLLALFIAAVAIWVEVLARHAEEKKEAEKRKARADKVVAAAIGECHHNLIHIALCYDGGDQMKHLPWGISIDSVCTLGGPEIRPDVSELLLDRLDAFRRTYETVQELRSDVQHARSDEERARAEDRLLSEPNPLQSFVLQNIGFLVEAWMDYSTVSTCRQSLEKPGLQDLPRLVRAASHSRARYQAFRTSDSEPQEEAATIRTEEIPIVCWIDDQPIGVATFALKPRFADAARAHRH